MKKPYILLIIKLTLIAGALALLLRLILDPSYTKVGGVIASLLLPFLPDIIKLATKGRFTLPFHLELVYLIFLVISLFLGIDLDAYRLIPYFDKVTHLISGVLTVILGNLILSRYKLGQSPCAFRIIFVLSISMGVAVLWEYFEFFCDTFLGQSMQQLLKPGVEDTMTDLLSASLGSLIALPFFIKK